MPEKNPPILSDDEVITQFDSSADRKGDDTPTESRRNLFRQAQTLFAATSVPRPNLASDTAALANVWQGRRGTIASIVCHTMSGSYEGTISWFKNPAAQASANISVAQDGRATIHVDPFGSNAPFANGYVCSPDAEASGLISRLGGRNLNYHTVSIEHEDKRVPNWQITNAPSQFQASTMISAWLCQSFELDPDSPACFLGHYQIDGCSRTGCPGWNSSTWNSYMREVNRLLSGHIPTTPPPVVVPPVVVPAKPTDPFGEGSWLAAAMDVLARNGIPEFDANGVETGRDLTGQAALNYLVSKGISVAGTMYDLNRELTSLQNRVKDLENRLK